MPYQQYLEFSKQCMKNCCLWSKSEARFSLNIPLDKGKEGAKSVAETLKKLLKK